jgi:hypothetical protein
VLVQVLAKNRWTVDARRPGGPLADETIYPIDRARILAGGHFDFKVEFPVIGKETDLRITIDGEDYSRQPGKSGQFVKTKDGLRCLAKCRKYVYDNYRS